MAGLFFVFSTFMMTALARLGAPQGIAAMQSVNVTILNPLFLTVFMGTAALCLITAVAAIWNWSADGFRLAARRQPALSSRHHRW